MGDDNKRKGGPSASQRGPSKKSKGGHSGKWQTSSQKSKLAERVEIGAALAVGDEGIWVTYARGMKGKAVREFRELCDEYGESLYGIERPKEPGHKDDDEEEQDIEASIQQELEALKPKKPESRQVFSIVGVNIECVFFVKTMRPVEPKELVSKICQDARECAGPMERKLKYINRLTPVTNTEKATENGILKVARSVMAPHFRLRAESTEGTAESAASENTEIGGESSVFTYAIRPNLRSHTQFKSMEVINKIAGIVQPEHKVNLTSPDQVVLIEIFQFFCGLSVVDGKEWERLKRYNVNELYRQAFDDKAGKVEDKTEDKTDEDTKADA